LLRKHLTAENAAELFELCAHRSAREVEELLAARFPRPDARDLVRRLPARAASTLDVGSSSTSASTDVLAWESLAEESTCGAPVAPTSILIEPAVAQRPVEASRTRRFEPLSADRFGVHFTADGEFCALLERVRGLAGHRLPSGDLMTLLKRGLEAYERELEKDRFAVRRKARPARDAARASRACAALDAPSELSTSAAPNRSNAPNLTLAKQDLQPDLAAPDPTRAESKSKPTRSFKRQRHYPATVVRAVFLRDGKQCSYVSPDGRRCNARRWLELDHISPVAVGGAHTIANLRLRCRAHNQRYARLYFGAARVDAALRNWRRHRKAPEGHQP